MISHLNKLQQLEEGKILLTPRQSLHAFSGSRPNRVLELVGASMGRVPILLLLKEWYASTTMGMNTNYLLVCLSRPQQDMGRMVAEGGIKKPQKAGIAIVRPVAP